MRSIHPFKLSLFLLSVTVLLWVPPILFFSRVIPPVVNRIFLKAPGLYLVYLALVFCPLAAIWMGRQLVRSGEKPLWGRRVIAMGMVLFAAFVVVVGPPTVRKALEPKTPKNPGAPRPTAPLTGLPVFPGAEGFGTRTPAGRGGKVIEVTSLADSGPGTLRAALADPDPRTIVFRVGGTIELAKILSITSPFVTVAGQTAPGDGILLKNAGLRIAIHDVLIQHIRIRPGDEGPVEPDDNDAIQILGRHGTAPGAYNVVIDHVSAGWSEDEAVSVWQGAHDVTISNSIISEALHRSRHKKRTHSAGLLVGDGSYHVSLHHNLFAHNSFRNPLISLGGTHDVVNNVIYDWGDIPGEIYDTDSNSFINFVGNYYLPGPSSGEAQYDFTIGGSSGTPQIYVHGNIGVKRPTSHMDEWAIVSHGWVGEAAPQKYRSQVRFPAPPVTTQPATDALEGVLSGAGATLPRRDPVDDRVVMDVRNKTGRIIDSPKEVGGYPRLVGGAPTIDTDRDGMPDEWERQKGLDPNDPSDGSKDRDGDGYTNLEEYLHSLLR